jgi:hypothetical protein
MENSMIQAVLQLQRKRIKIETNAKYPTGILFVFVV